MTRPRCRGYSLIELLVVLSIVGILAMVGVTMIGNRNSSAVRSILNELEGALLEAHKQTVATGQDVTIYTQGTWVAANPMQMIYGPATMTNPEFVAALATINGGGAPPVDTGLVFNLARSAQGILREHLNGGVDTTGTLWTNAMQSYNGQTNQDIATVEPFLSDATFTGLRVDGNRLFANGGGGHRVVISGTNKRFNTGLWIPVVGLANGNAIPGSAMGLIVVQANGATIYKFYNPGVNGGGDGQWRRI